MLYINFSSFSTYKIEEESQIELFFSLLRKQKKNIYIKCFILISNNNKRKNNDFIYF